MRVVSGGNCSLIVACLGPAGFSRGKKRQTNSLRSLWPVAKQLFRDQRGAIRSKIEIRKSKINDPEIGNRYSGSEDLFRRRGHGHVAGIGRRAWRLPETCSIAYHAETGRAARVEKWTRNRDGGR